VDGAVAQLPAEGVVVKLGQFVERGPRGRQMFPRGNIRQPLIAGDPGSVIGSEAVSRSVPDGNTLLINTPNLVIGAHLRPER
jgi:hypothetical protein